MIWLDGSVPIKYGLRLNMDEKYKTLKKELGKLADISANQILFVEITGSLVKVKFYGQIFFFFIMQKGL